jgi:hypothetical protein
MAAVNGLDYLNDHKNERNSESDSLTNDSSDDGPLNITNPSTMAPGSVGLKTPGTGKNQTSDALMSSKANVLSTTPKQNMDKPSGSLDRPSTPTSSLKEPPSTPSSAKHAKSSGGNLKKGNISKKARHR